MSLLRPYPLNENADAYISYLGKTVNRSHITVGKGIKLTRHGAGQHIELQSSYINDKMHFAGEFDPAAEYFPNDVVWVNGLNTYYTSSVSGSYDTGSVLPYYKDYPEGYSGSYTKPYLAAGLFVCVKYIPPSNMDSTVLEDVYYPNISNNGGVVDEGYVTQFRFNDYNVYYPIFPTIPTGSKVSVEETNWTVVANDNFWSPLIPYYPTTFCINGESVTSLIPIYSSKITFDTTRLPYSPPA